MRVPTSCIAFTVFSVACLGSSPALAAAFELREFSANAMGTAYAGAAAGSEDASFLFFNVALSSSFSVS